jgi:phage shock protein C
MTNEQPTGAPPPPAGGTTATGAGASGQAYPGQPGGYRPYGQPGGGPPARRLCRSRTNRCVAGVLGGLADYLGVEANALRVGFVLASVLFLAGFGGIVIYAVAWALVPEEPSSGWSYALRGNGARSWCGPDGWGRPPSSGRYRDPQAASWGRDSSPYWGTGAPPASPGALGGPRQVDPGWPRPADRAARSWALVLAACALAIVWSFGLARWWHSGAAMAWLFVMWVAVGLFVRRRRRNPWMAPAPTTGAEEVTGHQPPPPEATGQSSGDPGGPQGGDGGQGPGPLSPKSPEETDWAEAQAAAANWAAEQLAAAGVPAAPAGSATGPGSSTEVPGGRGAPSWADWRRRRYGPRRLGAVFAALLAAFVLLVVASVVGVTIGSGASLVGGVGDVTVAPANASQVRAHYRLGIGRLEVDLSHARFSTNGRTVAASVGVGELLVVLPRRTVVSVDAASGVGSVHLPRNVSSQAAQVTISDPSSFSKDRGSVPQLTVDAHVGVGVVEVRWSS